MNIALWIAAALLALAFLAAGLMKLTRSGAQLQQAGQGWVEDFSDPAVKGIGALEVLAAIGLILPAIVDIGTVLVPLAAVGLILMMVGAAATHARRREYPNIGANAVLVAVAVFVAVGRFGAHAF